MGEVDLNPNVQDTPTQQVDFNPQPDSSGPSPATAAARGAMFNWGLRHVLPNHSQEDMETAVASGNEDSLRQQASNAMDVLKINMRNQAARILGQIETPSDEVVAKLSQPLTPTDPNTVAETAWGSAFANQVKEAAYGSMKDTTYANTIKDYPRYAEEINRQGGIVAAQNMTIQKWMQNSKDAIDKQGYARAGYETAKPFVPFYNEVTIRHALAQVLPGNEKILLGEYLDEAGRRLLSMPYPQFAETMDNIFSDMVDSDPHTANFMLSSLFNQSTGDRYLNDLSTVFDITAIPGVSYLTKGIGKLFGTAIKDTAEVTAKSIGKLGVPERVFKGEGAEEAGWSNVYEAGSKEYHEAVQEKAAQGAGDLKEAAVQKTAKAIQEEDKGEVQKQAVQTLTSNFRLDVDNFTADIGHGGQELSTRMMDKWKAFNGQFKQFIGDLLRTETLSDVQANEVAGRVIDKAIKENYRGINNSVLDVKYMGLDSLSNTYRYELSYGRADGTLHQQWIWAAANKNLNGMLDAQIVRDGMGYKLVRTINLDETQRAISELLSQTEEGALQKTHFDGWLDAVNRYRTPKELLSIDENMQREISTHAPNVLLGLSKNVLEDVARVPKGIRFTATREKWNQWQRAVNHAKYAIDPNTGDPGAWFKTGADMDDFYLRNFGRTPDPIEKEAYVAVVRNIELNRVYDTIRLYSNKAKWGGEQHSISAVGKDGKKISSAFFEGRRERDFQKFSLAPDTTVYAQTGKGEGKVYRWGSMGAYQNLIKAKIQKGEWGAVQIWNPEHRPLADFGKTGQARVQWVVSEKFDTKPLAWENQIPRRGGGHFVYDYNYYIKQAKVAAEDIRGAMRHWYEGDTTVMPINIRKMGKEIAEHLNKVREFLKAGDENAARTYHQTNRLPMSWDEHRGWYKDTNVNGVYKPARLSLNEPFHVVPKDMLVKDMDGGLAGRYGKGFKDSTREGNPSRQMNVQFTGERDAKELMSVRDLGSRDNPLYIWEPAAFADPIHTMNRAVTRAVKSIYMQDMKNYSMNHWLRQAVEHMDVDGQDKLRTVMHSPSWYFNKGEWLKGHEGMPEVKKLEAARHQIKQFTGIPSKIDTEVHRITENLADAIYGKLGPKFVPEWMLHDVRDPTAFLRSAVVHMKLGLFNLPAFFVQASTHLNIWGIAGPRHAGPGAMATYLHTLARTNMFSQTLEALGKKAEGMGWRPGEWEEAWKELNRRGFTNIGHTHAFFDAPYQSKVIQTKWGHFLDAGHVFFREGAQSVRTAAWYTAYHEWRNGASWTKGAHATGKLSKQEWDRVMARAADLDHNMSRAANSQIQSGLMSFPMQFQTYHLRLMELMTGKRLSTAEKASLFATTSVMYGLPIGGLGIGLPFVGGIVGDKIKQSAQEELGYTPGDNFLSDVVMRGLPEAAQQVITGSGTNIPERWGPGKFDLIDNLMQSQSWWNVLGGATGTTFANIFYNSAPIFKSAGYMLTGKSDEFPMTPEDWLLPLQQVSSLSNAIGMYRTLTTGHLFSQNGADLEDVSKDKWRTAMMRYVVGLTPERAASLHDNYEWQKEEQDSWNAAEKNIIRELHRSWDEAANNNPDEANAAYKRAMAYGVGIPENVLTRILGVAAKGYKKPLVETLERKRFLQNIPPGQETNFPNIFNKLQGQQ